jgi:hypothetical protein
MHAMHAMHAVHAVHAVHAERLGHRRRAAREINQIDEIRTSRQTAALDPVPALHLHPALHPALHLHLVLHPALHLHLVLHHSLEGVCARRLGRTTSRSHPPSPPSSHPYSRPSRASQSAMRSLRLHPLRLGARLRCRRHQLSVEERGTLGHLKGGDVRLQPGHMGLQPLPRTVAGALYRPEGGGAVG